MKTFLPSILCFFISSFSIAQSAPDIVWQKTIGGSGDDFGSLVKTRDGGFISAGESYSDDGDATGNHGSSDIWVVKFDSLLNITWQKQYGGSNSEFPAGIQQTSDGGYVLAATSRSVDGDLSENLGGFDYWILKIDSAGSILWQKIYGGTDADIARNMKLTADGGYLVVGSSDSFDGDVTDNHSAEGDADCWVLKLNSYGDIEWKKCFGGSSAEEVLQVTVTPTGYVIIGEAFSNDGDISGNHGLYDVLVFKINFAGDLLWQHCYGGSGYESGLGAAQTADGGYIVAGAEASDDGQVTDHTGSTEYDDAWVFKIDSSGVLQWQRSFGGPDVDWARRIQVTTDGGYLFTGGTYSHDVDITYNAGGCDAWLVRLDSTGAIMWQKTMGGTDKESGGSFVDLGNGGWLTSNYTASTNGDIALNYGGTDFWIVKLCENLQTYYADADNDTYGDLSATMKDCTLPAGFTTDSSDCDDRNANIYPGAAEVPDSIDNNCDGSIDEGTFTLQDNAISIYPNPAHHTLTVGFQNDKILPVSIYVYSLPGNLLVVQQLSEKNTALDISILKAGLYSLKCIDKNGVWKEKKFIVE